MKSSTDLLERYLQSQSSVSRVQHSHDGSQDENEVTSRLVVKELIVKPQTYEHVSTPDTVHASLTALQHELDTCRARPALATLLLNHQSQPKEQPNGLISATQQATAAHPEPTKTSPASSVGQMLQDWNQLKSKHAVMLQANSAQHLLRTQSQNQQGLNAQSRCMVSPRPYTSSNASGISLALDGHPLNRSFHSTGRPHSTTCSTVTKPPVHSANSVPHYNPHRSPNSACTQPQSAQQQIRQQHLQPNSVRAPFEPLTCFDASMPANWHSCSGSCQSSTGATNIAPAVAISEGRLDGIAKAAGLLQRMSKPMRDAETQTDPVCSSWAWDMLSNTTDPAVQTALTLLAQLTEHPQLASTLFSIQSVTDHGTLHVQQNKQNAHVSAQSFQAMNLVSFNPRRHDIHSQPQELQHQHLVAGRHTPDFEGSVGDHTSELTATRHAFSNHDRYPGIASGSSTSAMAHNSSHCNSKPQVQHSVLVCHTYPASTARTVQSNGSAVHANMQAKVLNRVPAVSNPGAQILSSPPFIQPSSSYINPDTDQHQPNLTGDSIAQHPTLQAAPAASPVQSQATTNEVTLPPLLAARIQQHLRRKARRSHSQTGSVTEPSQLPGTVQEKHMEPNGVRLGNTTQCLQVRSSSQPPGNESESTCPSSSSDA